MGEISIGRRITMLIVAAVTAMMLSLGLMNTAQSTNADAAPKCPSGFEAVKTGPGEFACVQQGDPNEKFTCEEEFKGAPSAGKSEGEETLNPQGKPTSANQC
jgi:hypothetical protein